MNHFILTGGHKGPCAINSGTGRCKKSNKADGNCTLNRATRRCNKIKTSPRKTRSAERTRKKMNKFGVNALPSRLYNRRITSQRVDRENPNPVKGRDYAYDKMKKVDLSKYKFINFPNEEFKFESRSFSDCLCCKQDACPNWEDILCDEKTTCMIFYIVVT